MPAAAAGLDELAVDVAVVASHPPRTEGHTVNEALLLLEQHDPADDGRCRSCSAGGDSTGKVRAPCNIWLAANAALDRPDPQQP